MSSDKQKNMDSHTSFRRSVGKLGDLEKEALHATLGTTSRIAKFDLMKHMTPEHRFALIKDMTPQELKEYSAHQSLNPKEKLDLHNSLETSQPDRKSEETTLDSIRNLPIWNAFSHENVPLNDDLVQSLVDEQKISKLIEKQAAKSKQKGSYFVLGKQYRLKQEEAAEACNRLVAKQYRKVSLKVHPDRYGDYYQAEFDALLRAYDVLKDRTSRRDYVDKMLKVMASTSLQSPLVFQAHASFLEAHSEQQNQDTAQARYQKATQKKGQAQFYIEASVYQRPPKAIHINSLQGLTLEVVFPPICELELVQSVSVYCREDNEPQEKDRTYFKTISPDTWKTDSNGWIKTHIQLPDYGTYHITWRAKLRVYQSNTSETVETPPSFSREVDAEDPRLVRARQECPGLLNLAQELTLSLKKESRKLNDNNPQKGSNLEKQYWQLHQLIAKSRTVSNLLWRNLESLGQSYERALAFQDGVLEELLTWIDTCGREKSLLDDRLQSAQKKASLKSFKHSVAALMEQGTLAEWILTVQPAELANPGQEVNRLYQLLTESKQAGLWLDAASLQNAATRTDLFSQKQCGALVANAVQVETQMLEETQRLLESKIKEEKLEAERKALERQIAAVGLPLRTTVVLQDLVQRSDLNGSTGIYMGLSNKSTDRYIVRVAGVDMALAAKNFREWKGGEVPVPSTECTGINAGEDSGKDPANTTITKSPSRTKAKAGPAKTAPKAPALNLKWAENTTSKATPASKPAPKLNTQQKQGMLITPTTKGSTTQRQELASTKEPLPIRKVTMWIPKGEVSAFIGRKGSNVKAVNVESGARISVDKLKTNNRGSCAVYLEGNPTQIMKGQMCVERFLQERHQEKVPTKAAVAPTHNAAVINSPPGPAASPMATKPPKVAESPVRPQTPTTTESPSVPDSISILPPPASGEDASGVTDTMEPGAAATAMMPAPTAAFQSATAPNNHKMDSLFLFVCQQASCLKCKPEVFHNFLREQDIESLQDLKEAANDDDFLQEMLAAGLKGFKKAAFKRAVASAANDAGLLMDVPMVDNGLNVPASNNNASIQRELECPICYELMVNDPVTASDGYTYERHAITSWFQRHMGSPDGIRSPKTNLPMKDLNLVPNKTVLAMARDTAASA